MEDKFATFLPTQENSKWTLKQDAQLRECLEEFTAKLFSTMSQLETTEKNLENDSERLVLRLENIHNNIAALKMTKFVDERIIDVPSEVFKKTEFSHPQQCNSKLEQESRTTNAIKFAVKQGLQLISDHYREVNLVAPDFFADVDPNFVPDPVFEANEQYTDRKLPAIIGSEEFNASPTAGLFDVSTNALFTTNVTIKLPQNQQPVRSSSVAAALLVSQPVAKGGVTEPVPPAMVATAGETKQPVKVAQDVQITPKLPDVSSSSLQPMHVVESDQPSPIQSTTSKVKLEREAVKPEPKAPKPVSPVQTQSIQQLNTTVRETEPETKERSPQPIKAVFSGAQPVIKSTKKQDILFTSSSSSEEDDMSKPVMKSFDVNFSDRLAAAIKQGPVAMRSTKEGDVSKRPVSMSSVHLSAAKGDEAAEKGSTNSLRASVPRTTNSSVSSNEELGPSSVASRIAQIGDRIPIGGRTSAANKKPLEDESANEEAAKPPTSNDSVKERPKGPVRRAPSSLRKPAQATEDVQKQLESGPLTIQIEEKEKPGPPKVSPKTFSQVEEPKAVSKNTVPLPTSSASKAPVTQNTLAKPKIKSIFDSSSSGDDELAPAKLPTTKITAKKTEETSKPPLFGGVTATKKSAGSQPKKSLFEDSDSEE